MSLRSLRVCALFIGISATLAGASPQQDLEAAARGGKIAFILVTDQGASGVAQATDMVGQAMKRVKESVLVTLDRSDPASAELVARYRLAGAPVPLVLVAARNGALAGGMPAAQATPEQLVSMVPSPKKAEILQELQSGKAVFVVLSRKGMTGNTGAATACAAACGQMPGRSATVQIDLDDAAESTFLGQMNINRTATEPITLVVNAQGQLTGTYAGAVEVASLVQAATKRAGGCCPSTVQGGARSCAPTQR